MTRPASLPFHAAWVTLLAAGTALVAQTTTPLEPPIPDPPREFRAAWVATVANIDWPSKPGLPVAKQKEEALAILDRLAELNMNAVVFQVRPHADALYESKLEPWSYYLTGRQGRAPRPLYDPLEFWVREAHARGIQLHAWFNPYRANHPGNLGKLSPDSLVESRPELVVKLGDAGYYWMDPSLQAVQDHSVAVVLDVVRRYDVDGIHFDDYFYPYASYNDGADFPDQASYDAYTQGGGTLARNDWRRAAVDRFVERIYKEVKASKPHVEFGISPFGIWRPGHPEGIAGLDQYEVLYADAKRWLNEGWVDYFTPQLYWPIAQLPQSFPVLLGWWQDQNTQARHLWPGTSIGRARGEAGATEILNQVMIVRGMIRDGPGLCMFSMKSLMSSSSGLPEQLLRGPYARRALIPASTWLDGDAPTAPELRIAKVKGRPTARWQTVGDDAFLFCIYQLRDGRWSLSILPGDTREFALEDDTTQVAVSAVDRSRNESARTPRKLD